MTELFHSISINKILIQFLKKMEIIQIQVENMVDDKDNEVIYPIVDKAGIRDWILNYYYDLSVYNSKACNKLTGITLRHTDEYIYSIEFFYDEKSTGEFKGNTKVDPMQLNTTYISIDKHDYIAIIKGSFNVDYITGLEFILHSGQSYSFNNIYIKNKTDIKYFMFKKEDFCGQPTEIFSFKMAYGKFLTFIAPIFKDNLILIKNDTKNKNTPSYISPPMGRYNIDLKHFSVKEDFQDLGRLKKLCIFHDNVIVKGFEIYYENGLNYKLHNYSKVDDLNKLKKEIIDLDLLNGEIINKIMIRSGDLVDNITLYTNKDKVVSAGGHGGAPYLYYLNELSKINGNNLIFAGIEGGYSGESGNLNYVKLIFI